MVKFECNANDIGLRLIEEFVEFAAQKQVTCKFETRKQIVAKVESGAADSERDAERQIAAETGEKVDTVHKRNQRAKKGVGTKPTIVPTSPTPPSPRPQTWSCSVCGGTFPMDLEAKAARAA